MANAPLVLLGAALLAGASLWAAGCFDGDPRTPALDSAPAPADATRPAPAEAGAPARAAFETSAPTPQAPTADERTTLLLPDGNRVANLNGATNARPLAEVWPKNRPWSPIVRTERSDVGVDWYVHADGTRTTTEMKWRADLGRSDAVTRVAQPAPTDAGAVRVPPNRR